MALEGKTSRFRNRGTLQSCALFTLVKAFDEQRQEPVLVRRFAANVFPDDESWRQFRQILQSFSEVAMPGLLPVREVGGSLRQPWLVIGWPEGTTLRDRMKSAPPAQCITWLETAANTLSDLHALGHVHGRVQPETIFLDQQNQPLLEEIATVHALCAWDAQHHQLPTELIGELFRMDYVAPEIREGGPVTPQADQYALAKVLQECLTSQSQDALKLDALPAARRRFVKAIKSALSRALADDPQQRFSSCRDFLMAVRRDWQLNTGRRRRKLMVMGGLIVMVVSLFAYRWDRHRRYSVEQVTRIEQRKKELRDSIAQDFHFVPPKFESRDLTRFDLKARLNAPGDSKFALELFSRTGSSNSVTSPKLNLRLEETQPQIILKITPSVVRQTNADSEKFLFEDSGGSVNRLGSPPYAINWFVTVTTTPGLSRKQQTTLKVTLEDKLGRPVGETRTGTLGMNASTLNFNGSYAPASFQSGDALRAKVSYQENGLEKESYRSDFYRVGELVKKSQRLLIGPVTVKSNGFEKKTTLNADAGDIILVRTTGKITLGSESFCKATLGLAREPFGPEGLRVEPKAIANLGKQKLSFLSGSTQLPYGALLMRIGAKTNGCFVPPDGQPFDRPASGLITFSLNGACPAVGLPPSKQLPNNLCEGQGEFDVSVTVHSIRFPPEASANTKQAVRSQLKSTF